jgi:hypothetical protein
VRHVGEELVLEFQLLFLTDLKGAQQPLAFDRIADRALQMFARDIAFDQVILHSLMYRLDGQPLVVLAGKHDYRDAWRVFEDTAKGFGAAAIGQVQVEQNHRGRFPGQRIEPLRQPADTIDLLPGICLRSSAGEPGLHLLGCLRSAIRSWSGNPLLSYPPSRGRLTVPNQNSSIIFIAEKNSSRLPGFLT